MKKTWLLAALLLAPALVLIGCTINPDESAVRGIVTNFDRTLHDVIAGRAKPAALDDYFAADTDGANQQGLVNTRDAFRSMIQDHVSGVSLIQLSPFRITDVQIHASEGFARVTYRTDIHIVHGTQQGSATLSQDIALLRTARGWRISGGGPFQYSDIVGELPR